MEIENVLGRVTFYILDTKTLFLLSLYDADRLKAYFNNVENVIVRKDSMKIPIIGK